jgi:hypothetical protein
MSGKFNLPLLNLQSKEDPQRPNGSPTSAVPPMIADLLMMICLMDPTVFEDRKC